jgi:hypothetical protein
MLFNMAIIMFIIKTLIIMHLWVAIVITPANNSESLNKKNSFFVSNIKS